MKKHNKVTVATEDFLRDASRLIAAGRSGEAGKLCRARLRNLPDDPEALYMLSTLSLSERNYEEADRLLERLLRRNPDHVGALNNHSVMLLEHFRDIKGAEAGLRKVITLDPAFVDGYMNLGNVYQELGDQGKAEDMYRRALVINPQNGAAMNNLATVCTKSGKQDEAIKYYRRALELLQDRPEIYVNLMSALTRSRNKKDMLELVLKVIKWPQPTIALFAVYNFAKHCCLWDEAKLALDGVIKLCREGRGHVSLFAGINLPLLAEPGISNEELFELHLLAGKTLEGNRVSPAFTEHEKSMRQSSRLRIGYLSPDFRQHSVNTFFRGIINNHDRMRFEIHCYSTNMLEDEVTETYRTAADTFLNVSSLTDREIAERIHSDGVHILVDLAGYTENGRTGVLSYCPAPVQLAYLGYPYTSGLEKVDYIISDPYLDGPCNESLFSEKSLRLPESFAACDSLHEQVDSGKPPFEKNGFITFGVMNSSYKLSSELVRVWCRVMHAVTDSRIVLNHPNYDMEITRERVWDEFKRNGIDRSRVLFVWQKHPGGSHLRYYNDMDISLDTFPLTGGTTTIEALWMGVPVVTLVGEIYPQRISYSYLKNSGSHVEDMTAFSEDEYVEKAVTLADNPSRIADFRRTSREKMKRSILFDPVRLTRHLEAAYIEGWNRKFPGCPVSMVAPDVPVQFIPVRGNVEIAAIDSLDDINAYVLHEQQGCFDPEYEFVMQVVQEGMKVVDIGAGTGSYSVPISRRIGDVGRLWATTRTVNVAALLLKSRERNNLDNLFLLGGEDIKLRLDAEMQKHQMTAIDFVRMNTNASDSILKDGGVQFFAENSPLVMFGVKRDNSIIDTSLVSSFKDAGYDVYRYIPGLKAIAPFISGTDLDAFALNLFACKEDRAKLLEHRGLLIRQIQPVGELPGVHVKAWQEYIGALPYASTLLNNWLSVTSHYQDWEVYWVALNLFAMAKDERRQAVDRYACLQACNGILVMLVKAKPNLPRVLSFCRVLAELGKREEAVYALNQVAAMFGGGSNLAIDEPFLALSDESASVDPDNQVAEWLLASVLELREKLRVFSSFFTGQESLPVLEVIKDTGFQSSEMERRLTLIKKRYGIGA